MNELILIISGFMFFVCLLKANYINHKTATNQVKIGLIAMLTLNMAVILLNVYRILPYQILLSFLLVGIVGFLWLCYEQQCERVFHEEKS